MISDKNTLLLELQKRNKSCEFSAKTALDAYNQLDACYDLSDPWTQLECRQLIINILTSLRCTDAIDEFNLTTLSFTRGTSRFSLKDSGLGAKIKYWEQETI